MNKQMKTLNKKKKLNTNFPKQTSLPTRTTTKPYPTKVSDPTNKASCNQKYKTQFLLSNHQKLELWPMSLSNATKPSQNSTFLYHHNLLILL